MSYTRNLYHIIFHTKYGTPSILEENEDALYRINGMPDHLHLFVELHPMLSVAEFVQKRKRQHINGLMKINIFFLNFMRGLGATAH